MYVRNIERTAKGGRGEVKNQSKAEEEVLRFVYKMDSGPENA